MSTAGTAGELGGRVAGGVIGGIIGSFIPPPGLGTLLGRAVGSRLGGMAGRAAATALQDHINSMEEAEEEAEETDEAEGTEAEDEACQGCKEKEEKEDKKKEDLDKRSTHDPKDKKFNRDLNGSMDDANKDFDEFEPDNVRNLPDGGRVGELSGGRTINVRPNSSSGRPTLEIQKPNGRPERKYRYNWLGA